MARDAIGLYWSPWDRPEAAAASRLRRFGGAIGRHHRALARPREEDYMRRLFAERYPAGRFVAVGDGNDAGRLAAAAGTIVLLYPDPIGIGFGPLESAVRRVKRPDATVRVLNGRRRHFVLDRRTHRALRLRRLLRRSLFFEVILSAGFVVATPVLLAVDLARGRT